eukprot:10029479-Lingulodinium_polyedra.AAC.1
MIAQLITTTHMKHNNARHHAMPRKCIKQQYCNMESDCCLLRCCFGAWMLLRGNCLGGAWVMLEYCLGDASVVLEWRLGGARVLRRALKWCLGRA